MPKTSTAGALKGFRYDQPFVGFRTQFRTRPKDGKGPAKTHGMSYGGSCREELIWDTREFLQNRVVSWQTQRGTWRRTPTVNRLLDVEHPSLKQPGVTYLWLIDEVDDYDEGGTTICRRPCCLSRFPEVMDAVVGPVAVVLNEDRYVGDWWMTSPEDAAPKGEKELRWYGTDNFFLRHPVLTSLILGAFRQGILLFEQGFDEGMLRVVNRKEVEECLTHGDPKLAMRILTRLRPWLEVSGKHYVRNFPFPKGYWDRLRKLHNAIHKHGYDALFEGDVQQSWNVAAEAKEAPWANDGRYDVPNGPVAYWGTTGNKVTVAGKRLTQLGK